VAPHADAGFVLYNGTSYSLNGVQLPGDEALVVTGYFIHRSNFFHKLFCFAAILVLMKPEESTDQEMV
jgi:hypothetical protein